MKIHLQGVALLLTVMLVLLGMAKWASPTIHDALGPEGAIQATSSPEPDPGSPDAIADLPLATDEMVILQTILDSLLYDTGGIDGIAGPKTRAAIAKAIADLGLAPDTSNRKLLERLLVLTTNN